MDKVPLKVGSMRNQCPGCGKLFNSIGAFDKHRTGSYGMLRKGTKDGYMEAKRRCLDESDMLASGMLKNGLGFWISEPNETWSK